MYKCTECNLNVLCGQILTKFYQIWYQNNSMPNNCQCDMKFSHFVPDSLLIEHLKLSCDIQSFSLNLNFDFFEISTL